ncbi:MAG: transcription termination factor Rho [Opitutaceae bacterium]|nr:transcription termination factor Rho [Opitutaceae bacterium]
MELPPKNDNAAAKSEADEGQATRRPRPRVRSKKDATSSDGSAAPDAEALGGEERPSFAPSAPAAADSGGAGPLGLGRAPPEATPLPDGGGPGPGGGQQTPGEWQERGFWKRNRRDKRGKRGKFGDRGPWQPGGGGHTPYPLQPRPPETGPVFGELPDPARLADLAALDELADEISGGKGDPFYLDEIYALNLGDLTSFARKLGVTLEGAPARRLLLEQIFAYAAGAKREIRDRGWIDLSDRGGHGFIVHEQVNYRLYPEDAYLPEIFIRHYGLKRGHQVEVIVQSPVGQERCPSVVRVVSVMGLKPEQIEKITPFEELIPYYPLKRILLEATDVHKDVAMRAVDLLTPVGFGQRGVIVAPPRTGKTVLLQNIANSISNNYPEAKLILLLIDERPEEVTDFRRHTKGEVVSSTFDEAPENHIHCAEMVGEKARRLLEMGQDVVILLDSITRLARAYNALASNAGKIMSGGLEATALQKPKRFFGAARNIEGGGSLTILATALIDTGSRMDEIIFEEFKGTGNMELHLDRGLVDKRIFPAINLDRSGTRKEELIYHPDEMQRVHGLRRAMQGIPSVEAMEMFLTRLKKTKSNAEFLLSLNR